MIGECAGPFASPRASHFACRTSRNERREPQGNRTNDSITEAFPKKAVRCSKSAACGFPMGSNTSLRLKMYPTFPHFGMKKKKKKNAAKMACVFQNDRTIVHHFEHERIRASHFFKTLLTGARSWFSYIFLYSAGMRAPQARPIDVGGCLPSRLTLLHVALDTSWNGHLSRQRLVSSHN